MLRSNSEVFNPVLYRSTEWTDETKILKLSDTINSIKVWAGWEQLIPNPEITSHWNPLYKYIDFVVNTSDLQFNAEIDNYINLEQTMDFFIFINVLLGGDNAGKNLFMAQKSDYKPLDILPWDLDATWGRDWMANEVSPNGIISFTLFDRLNRCNPNNYNTKMKERWFQLRQDLLSPEKLIGKFENYHNLLVESGAAERETEKWPQSLPNPQAELDYLQKWIPQRINLLDDYFSELNIER